jgi:perosamine synthetase
MAIFNSLGSNYTLADAALCLKQLVWPNRQLKVRLGQVLNKHFNGQPVLLYNGRDAIEYCLEAYGLESGDEVLTQAWSCASIEEAIIRVSAQAVYFDLALQTVKVKLAQIQQAFKRSHQAKAVILQGTLGYGDDVIEIAKFCQEKKLLLILDLAQTVGARAENNQQLGAVADAIILSFGRDKILDGVSGGAVIFKTKPKKLPPVPDWFELSYDLSNKKQVSKLLFYPISTWLIRQTYDLGIGKILHLIAKKTHLIWTPIKSPHRHYQSMPAYFAPLVLKQLKNLDQQLAHRGEIAKFYKQALSDCSQVKVLVSEAEIRLGTNLRFPIQVKTLKVTPLLNYLAGHKIYVQDRWYRQPVDSGITQFKSSYQPGLCPEAEKLAQTVINLPTHRGISQPKARKIINLLKQYLKNN